MRNRGFAFRHVAVLAADRPVVFRFGVAVDRNVRACRLEAGGCSGFRPSFVGLRHNLLDRARLDRRN